MIYMIQFYNQGYPIELLEILFSDFMRCFYIKIEDSSIKTCNTTQLYYVPQIK